MRRTLSMALALLAAPLLHCSGGIDGGTDTNMQAAGEGPRVGLSPAASDTPSKVAVDPTVDYNQALRSAALKLTGDFPTLTEIKALQGAADPAAAYAAQVDAYLKDPRFAREQVAFWRNTFKMGGKVGGDNFDAAPSFAAMLVVQERPITELFTAKTGTCVQANADGTFANGSCNGSNTGVNAAGVLSDPGAMAQFFASMGFRRTRWVSETFVCQRYPAERRAEGVAAPAGAPEGYFGPYPFSSMPDKPINFQETAVICANCHVTMNRLTPLLGRFDASGTFQANKFGVKTPLTVPRDSLITDYLTTNESPAWRFGQPVANMEELGQAIAKDPEMARCMATRVWNWAFSRGDVIIDGSSLPADMVKQMGDELVANKYNLKVLIKQAFTSPSFIRY